jgi:hypothetical protein
MTADNLKDIKPVTNYSGTACKKRFEDLEAGTAKPTPESLENPTLHQMALIIQRREAEAQIERDALGMEISPGVFSAPAKSSKKEKPKLDEK